ncbi:ATP-binding protein [Flocculibacter collagenilyticus]|uniref:ATP-binding protein n=1 Tax=Flocculibacter collagenilyticus TaxID=2744479 RepID=UPI0018F5996D|nr:ATP-binding protein [Flocculibacter collagenilyticus]
MKLIVLSRYNKFVFTSHLLVLCFSFLISWLLYQDSLSEITKHRQARHHMLSQQIDAYIQQSIKFIGSARDFSSRFLVSNSPHSYNAASYTSLPPSSLPERQGDAGNLTLLGSLIGLADERRTELNINSQLQLVNQLDSAFNAGMQLIGAASGFYFLSNDRFAYHYPWLASSKWQNKSAFSHFDSFKKAIPQNNAKGDIYLTQPAIDQSNNTYSMSVGGPIYADQTFIGAIVVDISLSYISQIINEYSANKGFYVVIDEYEHVIAHPRFASQIPLEVHRLSTLLPDDLTAASVLSGLQNDDRQVFVDGYVIEYSQLKKTPWTVFYVEPYHTFLLPMIARFSLMFIAVAAVLLLLTYWAQWLTKKYFIKPAALLVKHIEHASIGISKSYQDLPPGWVSWFDKVNQAFNENRKLLGFLKAQNQELDSLVAQKTQELQYSNQVKERNLALLRSIMDTIPDHIYFKNIDGSYLGCNKAYEEFIGEKEERLVGNTSFEYLPHSQAQEITECENEVLTQQVVLRNKRIQTSHQAIQGIYDTLHMPFYSNNNELLGLVCIARDITHQEQTIQALKQSEIRFRSAMEYAANGVLLVSPSFELIQGNKALSKMLDVDIVEYEGALLSNILPRGIAIQLQIEWLTLFDKGNEAVFSQLPLHLKSGETIWLQISAALVWDSEHKPLYFIAQIQDISDTKQVAIELKQAKEQAEKASMAKGAFIANMSHEIRTPINAVLGMLQLLQTTDLNIRQLDYIEKCTSSATSLLAIINDVLDFSKAEAGKLVLKQVSFNLSDVVQRAFVLSNYEIMKKGLFTDFNFAKNMPIEVKGDPVRLGQVFINLITNAVKFTPMGCITLNTEFEQLDERQGIFTFHIRDTGIGIPEDKHEQLFDEFSQGDSSLTREHGGTGLGLSICRKLVEVMGGDISFTSEVGKGSCFTFNVRLSIEPSKPLSLPSGVNSVSVFCASQQLVESIQNKLTLCEVEQIHLIESQDDLLNQLSDVIIIDCEKMRQMMHLDTETVEQINNNSILQPINTEFGIDAGISIFKSFPIIDVPFCHFCLLSSWHNEPRLLSPKLSVIGNAKSTHYSHLNVLVVEDNAINQQVVLHLLEDLGVAPVVTHNGEEAVEIVGKIKFDLIIMDIQMPVMDGITATRLIRKKYDKDELTIVSMTAQLGDEEKQTCLDVGMNQHLTKPIMKQDLIKLLDSVNQAKLSNDQMQIIDTEFGLAQFANDESVYQSLLLKFVESYQFVDQELIEKYEQGATDQVMHSTHTIKGISGNLGLKRLKHEAQLIEQEIKAHYQESANTSSKMTTGHSLSFDAFSDALNVTIAEIQSYTVFDIDKG